jgi:fluoride ion exporter CrcB/FEX
VARYLAVTGMAAWLGRAFSFGTLAVNVTGCFLMGLALALLNIGLQLALCRLAVWAGARLAA